MPQDNGFEYKGHQVQVYVTPLGKKFHWEWESVQGPKGRLKGDSGASSKESAHSEAVAHARRYIDNL